MSAELGISRQAVHAHVAGLRQAGLEVEGRAGLGYRVLRPVTPLSAEAIAAALPQDVAARIGAIDLVLETVSTNAGLLALPAGNRHGRVLAAESQHRGRGRRGRGWWSPLGAGIWLSLGWRLQTGLAGLGLLSQAVGVAVTDALADHGIDRARLKWPNDVLLNGRKLAGCLVELSGQAEGPVDAVIGVGLNCHLPERRPEPDGDAWADLSGHSAGGDRNRLMAAVIARLLARLDQVQQGASGEILDVWTARDALTGRRIFIHAAASRPVGDPPSKAVSAGYAGVSPGGALRAEVDGEVKEFHAGEVSVRVSG